MIGWITKGVNMIHSREEIYSYMNIDTIEDMYDRAVYSVRNIARETSLFQLQ